MLLTTSGHVELIGGNGTPPFCCVPNMKLTIGAICWIDSVIKWLVIRFSYRGTCFVKILRISNISIKRNWKTVRATKNRKKKCVLTFHSVYNVGCFLSILFLFLPKEQRTELDRTKTQSNFIHFQLVSNNAFCEHNICCISNFVHGNVSLNT